jgi:hypothetical protein
MSIELVDRNGYSLNPPRRGPHSCLPRPCLRDHDKAARSTAKVVPTPRRPPLISWKSKTFQIEVSKVDHTQMVRAQDRNRPMRNRSCPYPIVPCQEDRSAEPLSHTRPRTLSSERITHVKAG